ncbi:hypothetical protein VNO78_28824 [Psophocarpus tetragonolobus]|uniref:Uncharacterized protein n=1 Tax=Psophocarpus tetragonolobus TaxID=3891 RepID=A0AAN9RTV4_PSOTE
MMHFLISWRKIRRKKDPCKHHPFGKLPNRHTLSAFGHITNHPFLFFLPSPGVERGTTNKKLKKSTTKRGLGCFLCLISRYGQLSAFLASSLRSSFHIVNSF